MQEKINELIAVLYNQAEILLTGFGEFFPFVYVITNYDEVRAVVIPMDKEHPPAQEVLEELLKALRYEVKEKKYKAIGICVDVSIKKADTGTQTDAIEMRINMVGGYSMNCYKPYVLGDDGTIVYDDLFIEDGSLKLF